MKAKIFLIFLCVFLLINATFAGNPFDLPELKLSTKTDQRLWIGDNWIKDSTNYFVMNQGLLVWDSLRVRRDLYVGELGGTIYLDTNRTSKIYVSGYSLYIENLKGNGALYLYCGTGTGSISFSKFKGSGQTQEMGYIDSANGLTIAMGDIQLTGGTQQIKVPSDTASDYDSDDGITLNKQSGILTTKALTTAALGDYTLTLTNSLIVATSKVFANINDNLSGTGTPIIRQCKTTSGSALIVVANINASDSLNGVLTISFLVIN